MRLCDFDCSELSINDAYLNGLSELGVPASRDTQCLLSGVSGEVVASGLELR